MQNTINEANTARKNKKKQEESNMNELKKNFEKTAREGLKEIPIPELKTTGPGENVVIWVETIRRKYGEVKKHAPSAMS